MTHSTSNLAEQASSDGRQQARTHLFVLAALYTAAGSTPVHIRNMSPSGALLQGSALPEAGSKVTLKRGKLRVMGAIAWKLDRKAGVTFDAPACVADWMTRQGSIHQLRADQLISRLREGSGDCGVRSLEPKSLSSSGSVEAELTSIRADLVALGNLLVRDAPMVAAHPEIQTLDVSVQRIDSLLLHLTQEKNLGGAGRT